MLKAQLQRSADEADRGEDQVFDELREMIEERRSAKATNS